MRIGGAKEKPWGYVNWPCSYSGIVLCEGKWVGRIFGLGVGGLSCVGFLWWRRLEVRERCCASC